MSEAWKIALTSCATLIGGVILYGANQVISKFVIDPIHEQRKVIGEIADALIFYANYLSNPGIGTKDAMDQASRRLRELATLLHSKTYLIPWYGFFERARIVVRSSAVRDSSQELVGLSNSVHMPPESWHGLDLPSLNHERTQKIERLLNLRLSAG